MIQVVEALVTSDSDAAPEHFALRCEAYDLVLYIILRRTL